MKEDELPVEIKNIISSLKISDKMYSFLWKKNSDFIKENTLEYDINAIYESLKKNQAEIINRIEIDVPDILQCNVLELQNELISFFESIFYIEEIICGNDYINEKMIKRIGINSNMCMCDNKYYTYAACHHCYPKVNKVPSKYIAYSPCYRIESKQNKFRRNKFHMFEVIEFDTAEQLEKQRYLYIYIMKSLLEKNGIKDIRVIIANDSFVTDSKEKIAYQMLNKSKVEIQVYSSSIEEYVAIASINMHYKQFIQKFEIDCNVEYNSMCFGIGLERLHEIILERKNNIEALKGI